MQQNHVESKGYFRKHDPVFVMLPPERRQVERPVIVELFHHSPVIPHGERSVIINYFLDQVKNHPREPNSRGQPKPSGPRSLSSIPEPGP